MIRAPRLRMTLGGLDAVLTLGGRRLEKSNSSAGVAHWHSGSVGRIGKRQIEVFPANATRDERTISDRELYLSKDRPAIPPLHGGRHPRRPGLQD